MPYIHRLGCGLIATERHIEHIYRLVDRAKQEFDLIFATEYGVSILNLSGITKS